MGIEIVGGSTGMRVDVTQRNQLEVFAQSVAPAWMPTVIDGVCWTLPFDAIDPTGADDYFLYVRNLPSSAIDIVVGRYTVFSTVAGTVEIQRVTGTAAGGTDVTPVNRRVGNSNVPNITYQTGVDITGLSDSGVLEFCVIDATASETRDVTAEPIVLPPGQAIAFLWTAATGILTGNITVWNQTARPSRLVKG
jgi:hypothetical protein